MPARDVMAAITIGADDTKDSQRLSSASSEARETDLLLQPLVKRPSTRESYCKELTLQTGSESTWVSSAFIMANIIIGVGLLNFPAAYRDAGGLPTAIPIQLVCMCVTLAGMLVLVHCAELAAKDTYQEVVEFFCGGVGLVLCNGFIVVHNLGTCITVLVILADQVDQILGFAYGPNYCDFWFMRRSFTLSMLTIFLILPLSYPQRMDTFKFASVIGVCVIGYIIFLSMWKYYTSDEQVHLSTRPKHWIDIFKVVPVICFSFEGHVEAVPLYSGFKKRTLGEFAKAALLCYAICLAVYTVTGTYGYITFGDRVKSDLLTSYHPLDVTVVIATAIMGLKSITAFPIIFFCVRLVVEDMSDRVSWCRGWSECRRRLVLTTLLVVICLLLALLVPSIGSVITLLGGSASLFLFVFPGLCYVQASIKSHTEGTLDCSLLGMMCGVLLVVLGTFLAATTTVQSIIRLSNGEFIEKHGNYC